MYALLRMLDESVQVYPVSEETFGAMQSDFAQNDRTVVYALLEGGRVPIRWSEVRSLERHDEDPRRILDEARGSEDAGPSFTPDAGENG